jgi:hypothetical protein
MGARQVDVAAWEDRMSSLPRIVTAEPVIHGVLKVVFTDGYEGVVDLRPLLDQGRVFAWLQQPEHFQRIRIDEFGHSVSWIGGDGQEIDISADSLRRDAERQEEQHKLIAG